ncbi:MAG TPA: leucyl aminopeptidase [Bacteroidetes bacterium]|nr:leucyl aminopeptidase [Bacteroidota bacterium]
MTIYPDIIQGQPDDASQALIFLVPGIAKAGSLPLPDNERNYLRKKLDQKEELVVIQGMGQWKLIVLGTEQENLPALLENSRKLGTRVRKILTEAHIRECGLVDSTGDSKLVIAFLEGMVLSGYQFLKYLTGKEKEKRKYSLEKCTVSCQEIPAGDFHSFRYLLEGVYAARDLVNEPLSYLTAVQLGKEFEKMGTEAGFRVEVFNKKKIESLRMGGLLAVNRGSIDPPTFTVMEYKPPHAVNKKPYVLVGKGVVYDTGGLSLKPTKDSMDYMKSDMAGAAAVAGAMYAIARSQLPVHVLALVPATDNRPDGNAYAPGDVITMYDGTTVEVLNTDAEGRMILADALSYARQYEPELVVELSTLTGSASMALGPYGIVGMGNAGKSLFTRLQQCGEEVYERVVEFPFWQEYRDQLKSEIADLKNIGEREGGAISAGKFLEHFTGYPFIHLDIAGPAFLNKENHYRKKGGTGVGVRLLVRFFREITLEKEKR